MSMFSDIGFTMGVYENVFPTYEQGVVHKDQVMTGLWMDLKQK